MEKKWENELQRWIKETSISKESASWAIQDEGNEQKKDEEIKNSAGKRELEKEIKTSKKQLLSINQEKEKGLDNLSLSSPSSYKLQVSVPITLNLLLKAWAAAEGRDLASVALQCLEIGLRESKSKGNIPLAAVEHYERNCEKRLAIAEVNKKWERFSKRYS